MTDKPKDREPTHDAESLADKLGKALERLQGKKSVPCHGCGKKTSHWSLLCKACRDEP